MKLSLSSLLLVGAIAVTNGRGSAMGSAPGTASSWVSKGDSHLSAGEFKLAIDAYDSAVKLDPENYLYVFKRSAAYLSVGRNQPALQDLNKVLELKPEFEGALTQRARINLKLGKFDLAQKDARSLHNQEILDMIEHTKKLEKETAKSVKQQDWESCIHQSSEVLSVCPNMLSMRNTRAKCRLSKGDAREALVDLSNVIALSPSDPEPYVTMAKVYYYCLNEYDNAMQQVQRCLRFDQDCKECKQIHKQIKKTRKALKEYDTESRRKKASGHRLWGEMETKLIGEGFYDQIVKESEEAFKDIGLNNAPTGLVDSLGVALCDAYFYLKKYQAGVPYCEKALQMDPTYANGLLLKAEKELEQENFDAAVAILSEAIQAHQIQDNKLHSKLREAQTLAHRAKTKDYYKILGVSRSANDREIKKAYRSKTKEFHPDKYKGDLSQEQVERKMSDINEAYEVLTDDEKRQRYDAGEEMDGSGGFTGNPFQGGGHPGGGNMKFHFNGFPGGGAGGQHFQFQEDFGGFDFGKFADAFRHQQNHRQQGGHFFHRQRG